MKSNNLTQIVLYLRSEFIELNEGTWDRTICMAEICLNYSSCIHINTIKVLKNNWTPRHERKFTIHSVRGRMSNAVACENSKLSGFLKIFRTENYGNNISLSKSRHFRILAHLYLSRDVASTKAGLNNNFVA